MATGLPGDGYGSRVSNGKLSMEGKRVKNSDLHEQPLKIFRPWSEIRECAICYCMGLLGGVAAIGLIYAASQ